MNTMTYKGYIGQVTLDEDAGVFHGQVKNTRDIPAKIEIRRNFDTTYWTLTKAGDFGQYEKVDADTVEFTLELSPRSEKAFEYTVTTYHGTRQEDWVRLSNQ